MASFTDIVTFSRGSNATIVDATGKITYAPNNLLRQSQTFDSATWTKTNTGGGASPTVTADYAVAPDGTMTADRVQFSLNGVTSGATSQLRQTASSTTSLVPAIFSVWLKSNTGSDQIVRMIYSAGATTLWTVTDEWQRFYYRGAFFSGANFGVELASGVTANTADILIWGAQLEQVTYQTAPSDYITTVASAYYGPRFGYNPVTLAPQGFLVEEQRTNLLPSSEELTGFGWGVEFASVAINTAVSPDGTTNADKLVEDTTNSTHNVKNTSVTTTAVATTFSAYAKPAGRSWIALSIIDSGDTARVTYFNVSTGTVGTTGTGITANITPSGDGWYRCAATVAAAKAGANQCNIFLIQTDGVLSYQGDGTSGAYIWGVQVEAGAFATAYIKTAAATATRSADVATITGSNFSTFYNATEGTVVCTVLRTDASGATRGAWRISDGTANNGMDYLIYGGNNTVQVGGVTQANITPGAGSANAVVTNVFTFKNNSFSAYTDTGAVVTDTSGSVPTVNVMSIGLASQTLCGYVQSIQFYPTISAG